MPRKLRPCLRPSHGILSLLETKQMIARDPCVIGMTKARVRCKLCISSEYYSSVISGSWGICGDELMKKLNNEAMKSANCTPQVPLIMVNPTRVVSVTIIF